ncbi:ATP-binding cassette domain-containing protein [bacterium]|nr:ATP-binding cassette domain-containing protein [bacterium]
MTKTVLQVDQLSAGYKNRPILHDISFAVPRGEIRVILGASGCGKTTLLKNIIGLEEPLKGSVTLLDNNVHQLVETGRYLLFQRIGVLFQNGALFGSLTIAENVALPLRMHTTVPEKLINEMVKMKLGLVQLESALHLYPAELSGGMRKRAALARAMIMDPEILFCDEPSAGLDPITGAELDDLILNIRQLFGLTIIVVTHELMSIRTIADSVLMLSEGTIIFDGPLSGLDNSSVAEIHHFMKRSPVQRPFAKKSVLDYIGRKNQFLDAQDET